MTIKVGEDVQQRAKVGVFGIGLEAYWDQFEGLRDRLEGYRRSVEERIGQWATVVSPGLVDTAPKASAAGERFAEERVDLIFCHAATYATSSQVLPAVQRAGVPVVLNLQPSSSLDYENTDTGAGVGHHAGTLRKVARLLGLEFIEVGLRARRPGDL